MPGEGDEHSTRCWDTSTLKVGDIARRVCCACDVEQDFTVDFFRGGDQTWSGKSTHEPCGARLQALDVDYPPWATYVEEAT